MLLSDKGGEAKRTNRSLFSLTTAVLQLFFLEHKITKMHNLPFLCLLTPDSILQDFASVFNHLSGSGSCLAQAAGGRGGGGGEGVAGRERRARRTHILQVRNWHSCSPVRPRPMSSSPGSAN